ncbi:homocysteine S-methyltransferase family protein [Fuchsiella alkaliacetigena]|uniref:homocysteine S-methyltransferase family protein n=1 Tax=Fuchsiella alkaliacetigena TaxID=957042 RepID=UPI002009E4F4|nr:homocysteine S-methyltransferase family protein [Fuchsiella alkaliacetigena]MCK8823916.1 homocysteine S-methyltransferase family protein [Fuchsiella alkaliacetigena]
MDQDILELLAEKVLLFDGAMGTRLQEVGLTEQIAPEEWNLKNPEAIKGIHRSYVEAGSDIIETNTFGANRVKLKGHGLADQVEEINRAAVQLALEVSEDNYVAASVGPLGEFLAPVGRISFREAVEIFQEQIGAQLEAGADLLVIETMSDPQELKAAVVAAREIDEQVPIIALMTFDENLRTLMGTTPEVAAVILSALEVDVIGANCSLGPAGLLEVGQKLQQYTNKPLMLQPNAGLPELVAGETVYKETPQEMAMYLEDFVATGVRIIGGCCGTNPEHIKVFAEELESLVPVDSSTELNFNLASRAAIVELKAEEETPLLIGDKINTIQNKELKEELEQGSLDILKSIAQAQQEAGAEIININLSNLANEVELLPQAVEKLQRNPRLALAIESSNLRALEAALTAANAKLLVSSQVSEEKLAKLLALVKRHGAAVNIFIDTEEDSLGLQQKMKLARQIKAEAAKHNLATQDLLINPLSATEELDESTLKVITSIKSSLGLASALRADLNDFVKTELWEIGLKLYFGEPS